jgi:hypothetical protein
MCSGCAAADGACRILGHLALVDLALMRGSAGGAQNQAAEAVPGRVAVPAAGYPGAWLAGGKDEGASGGMRHRRGGRLAVELSVDHSLQPCGAGGVAACFVDALEDVLRDAELQYRARHMPPGRMALYDSARVVRQQGSGFAGLGESVKLLLKLGWRLLAAPRGRYRGVRRAARLCHLRPTRRA